LEVLGEQRGGLLRGVSKVRYNLEALVKPSNSSSKASPVSAWEISVVWLSRLPPMSVGAPGLARGIMKQGYTVGYLIAAIVYHYRC